MQNPCFLGAIGIKEEKRREAKCFNVQAQKLLDDEIARMMYSVGLLFNLAKNSHYVRAYKPLGYNALRITLL